MHVVPFTPCEPTDDIPRSCQLNTDVPQVTQLLNLAKIHKPEIKCRSSPITVQETGILLFRSTVNVVRTACIQITDVCKKSARYIFLLSSNKI